jgi:hypothetical protein
VPSINAYAHAYTHTTLPLLSRPCNISSQVSGLVSYYYKHFRADAHSYLTQTHNTNTCTHIRCRDIITSNNMHAPKQTHPKIYLISLHHDGAESTHSHSQRGSGSVCKRMIVCIFKCVRGHMTCMVGMGKCARAWERLIVLGMCVCVCVCVVHGMHAMHTQISSFLAFSCGVRARVFQLWIDEQTCMYVSPTTSMLAETSHVTISCCP